ncbi:MAG: tautomerase family protein [Candidatus Bathyarchaeota archaeon]|nr:tautomerase family protein [Candidatus Bathyarchaeota archaeon]
MQVNVWAGMSPENKQKVVEGITRVFTDMGIPSQATTVMILEVPKENWASGGKLHSQAPPDLSR